MVQDHCLEKRILDPFSTHFWSQSSPFSRQLVFLKGPRWFAMGSNWAHFNCLDTPNGLGLFLENPFLTHPVHFLSENSPF